MQSVTITHVVQLVIVALTVAVGQVLLKYGAGLVPPINSVAGAIKLFAQPVIIGALALYGFGAILWIVTLQHVPLTTAYPFIALSFALTPLAAIIVLHEPVDSRYFVGIALILSGIYLASAPRSPIL